MDRNAYPCSENPKDQDIIEWSVLDALLAFKKPGAPDPRRRVIAIYLDSAPKLMETILASFAGSDSASLKKAAHSLKSASMNVGANGLGNICAALERIPMEGPLDGGGELIENAETSYKAVMASLEEALRRMSPN